PLPRQLRWHPLRERARFPDGRCAASGNGRIISAAIDHADRSNAYGAVFRHAANPRAVERAVGPLKRRGNPDHYWGRGDLHHGTAVERLPRAPAGLAGPHQAPRRVLPRARLALTVASAWRSLANASEC